LDVISAHEQEVHDEEEFEEIAVELVEKINEYV